MQEKPNNINAGRCFALFVLGTIIVRVWHAPSPSRGRQPQRRAARAPSPALHLLVTPAPHHLCLLKDDRLPSCRLLLGVLPRFWLCLVPHPVAVDARFLLDSICACFVFLFVGVFLLNFLDYLVFWYFPLRKWFSLHFFVCVVWFFPSLWAPFVVPFFTDSCCVCAWVLWTFPNKNGNVLFIFVHISLIYILIAFIQQEFFIMTQLMVPRLVSKGFLNLTKECAI